MMLPPIERSYTADDVLALRGSVVVEHTLARLGAERLRALLRSEECVAALGALTGGQAVQMVQAGLQAIYLSGWQVAADANLAGQTYPDQSLYPSSSAPALVARINNALLRADQIAHAEGRRLDALAGADRRRRGGRVRRAAERVRADEGRSSRPARPACTSRTSSRGEEVRAPRRQGARAHARSSCARSSRRASRRTCADVPTVLIARTDALSATLLTSDVDERDREFLTGERTPEGFFRVRDGIDAAIARGLAYAPYADLLWVETSTPDLRRGGDVRGRDPRRSIPGKLLAYNCSPSFNWARNLSEQQIATLPGRSREPRLPLPVRHARRLPRAQRTRCSSSRAAIATAR